MICMFVYVDMICLYVMYVCMICMFVYVDMICLYIFVCYAIPSCFALRVPNFQGFIYNPRKEL